MLPSHCKCGNASRRRQICLQESAIKRSLDALSLAGPGGGEGPKDKYAFWETQPVTQFGAAGASEEASRSLVGYGPVQLNCCMSHI